jgi:hypothetical protein
MNYIYIFVLFKEYILQTKFMSGGEMKMPVLDIVQDIVIKY